MLNPFTVIDILRQGVNRYPNSTITSRQEDGAIISFSYQEIWKRVNCLADSLNQFNLKKGDRVATLAWNNNRHFELYYAIAGAGQVVHTINPRLFSEQLEHIIEHAEDKLLFVEPEFVSMLETLASVQKMTFIVLCHEDDMPKSSLNLICYESLLNSGQPHFSWPKLSSNEGAVLCYTSGTTGLPKGVLYSHESILAHATAICRDDAFGIGGQDIILPIVPMFHVCAWGIPFSAPLVGADLVLPHHQLQAISLNELIQVKQVSLMLGVPTVWQALLDHCEIENQVLRSVQRVVIGGAAAPFDMLRRFDEQHQITTLHAWGMTELSPVGTVNNNQRLLNTLSKADRDHRRQSQGQAIFGIELRLVNDNGQIVPQDGKNSGHLQVRGPWVLERYFGEKDSALTDDGWFETGDIANIDELGYMHIVDRAKDLVKSGGEWISSVALENTAIGFSMITHAAVIAAKHPKWGERPVMIIKASGSIEQNALRDYLANTHPKWSLPDQIIQLDELPMTATGKILKSNLRDKYQDILLLK